MYPSLEYCFQLFVVALLIIAKANEASSKTLEGKDIEEPEVPGKESDEPKVPAVLGTDQYTWSWWWDMWIKLSLKICKTTVSYVFKCILCNS